MKYNTLVLVRVQYINMIGCMKTGTTNEDVASSKLSEIVCGKTKWPNYEID